MRNMLFVATGTVLGLAAAAFALARPAALPEAAAQTVASAAGSEVGPVMMGIGASQQNQNDLCWVLFRDKPRKGQKIDHDRFTLCLYRAVNNGQAFDIVDVREVTYDFKANHLNVPGHNPRLTFKAMREAYEAAIEEENRPPKPR